MAKEAKNFLVSTANFVLKYNGQVACTGTTNLNTSIEVTMEEQNVNAGKGNKLVYSYKYGREFNVTLETANWDLKYIAANVGTDIAQTLAERYSIGECVTLTSYVGTLPKTPVGKVAVDLGNGTTVEVTPTGTTIDLSAYSAIIGDNKTVNVTYCFDATADQLIIDASTSPKVYELILDADKHNNQIGKVGSVQIYVPSYQPSGNFNIEFTPDGVSSTNIDGKALAVEGDTCEAGNSVYAYVNEYNDAIVATSYIDIAASPANIEFTAANQTKTLTVYGLRGAGYSNTIIDNSDVTFTSSASSVASVSEAGVVTALTEGTTYITATYGDYVDTVKVVVDLP